MKDSEYNEELIERYEDRLKETKEKRDDGEKPKKNETSFSNQIKGLNDKLKELRSRDKKGKGTKTREEKRKEYQKNLKIIDDVLKKPRKQKSNQMDRNDPTGIDVRDGGAMQKTYGMKEGGFTKRGGMYKKGY